MRIEALKYRTEDKNDIIICVDFYESYRKPEWRIADIKYKASRQRKYKYFSETFRDDYDYRKLDVPERWIYALKKFEEFVGRDKLEEAIMAAWKSFEPNLEEILVGNI
jgi:hypothetical protein